MDVGGLPGEGDAMTPESSFIERAARQQRLTTYRRAGLVLGAFLAFVFGGFQGLALALTMVVIVRLVNAWRVGR